jgi:hypothetical protein
VTRAQQELVVASLFVVKSELKEIVALVHVLATQALPQIDAFVHVSVTLALLKLDIVVVHVSARSALLHLAAASRLFSQFVERY